MKTRNGVLKVIVMDIVFILLGCGEEVRESGREGAPHPAWAEESRVESRLTGLTEPERLKRELERAGLKAFERDGRVGVLIGGAELQGIVPDAELSVDAKTLNEYIVTFGKAIPGLSEEVVKRGGLLGAVIPPMSAVVRMKDEGSLKSLPGVKEYTVYQPYMKYNMSGGHPREWREARIQMWDEQATQEAVKKSLSLGLRVLRREGKTLLVSGSGIEKMALEPGVFFMEKNMPAGGFSVCGYAAVKKLALPVLEGRASAKVAVLDMGLDVSHPDLSAAEVYDWAKDGDTGELTAHGTHLAGIIAGSGRESSGKIMGVNPGLKPLFFALGDDALGLVVPSSLESLFSVGQSKGVSIYNMSWGTYSPGKGGEYLSVSRDVDSWVYEHPESIVVVAVGNDGKSIASPATAKNVISVGALSQGELADFTPRNYCHDGRVKPDIAAPGVGIEATGLAGSYKTLQGTSQAAAVVSGLLSKLVPMLNNGTNRATHAMVKAFLVAQTPEDQASSGFGFGRLYLKAGPDAEHFRLMQAPSWEKMGGVKVKVKAGDRLSAVLVWTDPPSYESSFRNLMNDLDLVVTAPDGTETRLSDRVNPAEKIVVGSTLAGEYTVKAVNVFEGLRYTDIALCVYSRAGFDASTNSDSEEESASAAGTSSAVSGGGDVSVAEVSGGSGTGGSTTGLGSGSSGTGSGASGTGTELTATVTAAEEAYDAYGELENAAGMEEILDLPVIAVRPGSNTISLRALGSATEDVLEVELSGSSVTSELKLLPVKLLPEAEFESFGLWISESNSSNQIAAQFDIRHSEGETPVSVILSVDSVPPVLGKLSPSNNAVWTNALIFACVTDAGSGVRPDARIRVNGIECPTNSYRYDYTRGGFEIEIDEMTASTQAQAQAVTVCFADVRDSAGNKMAETNWMFVYKPGEDRAPSKPTGLTGAYTNRMLVFNWETNRENDIAGYRMYELDADYAKKGLVTNALVGTNYLEGLGWRFSSVALAAVDEGSNESEWAVLTLDTAPEQVAPCIVLKSAVLSTNAPMLVEWTVEDDGGLVSTNAMLGGSAVKIIDVSNGIYGVWVSNDGTYTLSACVTDDEGLCDSEEWTVSVDSKAPDAVKGLTWNAEGMTVILDWEESAGASEYRVEYKNTTAATVTTNHAEIPFEDYVRGIFSVSAYDGAGNRSLSASVLVSTEGTMEFGVSERVFSSMIQLSLSVPLDTNSYTNLVFEIVSPDGVVMRRLNHLPVHEWTIQESTEGLAEGKYDLRAVAEGRDGKQCEFHVDVDRTPPSIYLLHGEKKITVSQLFFANQDQLQLMAEDSNLVSVFAYTEDGEVRLLGEKSLVVEMDRSRVWNFGAMDRAGNLTGLLLSAVRDDEKPRVLIEHLSNGIYGVAADDHLSEYAVYTNGARYYASKVSARGFLSPFPQAAFTEGGELTLTAVDFAGWTNSVSLNIEAMTNEWPLDDITVNGTHQLYLKISDALLCAKGAEGQIRYWSIILDSGMKMESGPLSANDYSLTGLEDGKYRVGLECGGESRRAEFTVDTTAPEVKIQPVIVSGAPASEWVKVSDRNPGTTETHWESGSAESGGELRVTAVDLAGNVTKKTATVAVVDASSGYGIIVADLSDGTVEVTAPSGTSSSYAISSYFSAKRAYNYPVVLGVVNGSEEACWKNSGAAVSKLKEEGEYTLLLSGGTSATLALRLDYTAPSVVCTAQDGESLKEAPVLTGLQDGEWAVLTLDGVDWPSGLPVTEGIHTFAWKLYDLAGNTSSLTRSIIIDRTAPSMTAEVTNRAVCNHIPEVSVSDLSSVDTWKWVDGETNKEVGSMAESYHTVRALAVDRAGNSNEIEFQFRLDLTPPMAVLSPTNGVYRSAELQCVAVEEAGLTRTGSLNGKAWSGSNTNLTLEGDYRAVVILRDAAGNTTTLQSDIAIDTTKPEIDPMGFVSNHAYATGTPLNIGVSDLHPGQTVLTVNGKEVTNGAALEKGSNALSVLSVDRAGNSNTYKTSFAVVDGLPELTLSGLPSCFVDGTYYSPDSVGITAHGEGVSGLTVMVDSLSNGMTANVSKTGVSRVRACGTFVWMSNSYTLTSREVKILIDPSAPELTMSGGSGNLNCGDALGFSAGDRLSGVSFEVNGVSVSPQVLTNFASTADRSGAWKLLCSAATFDSGTNVLKVAATDVLGRRTVLEKTLLYEISAADSNSSDGDGGFPLGDEDAPVLAITGVSEGDCLQRLCGTLKADDLTFRAFEFYVYTNNQLALHMTTNVPTVDLSCLNPLLDSRVAISIEAVDWSQNRSTTNLNCVIDTTPPALLFDFEEKGVFYSLDSTVRVIDTNLLTSGAWIDGKAFGTNFTNLAVVTNVEGEYDVTLFARDKAGNTNRRTLHFTIDQTAPVISIAGVENGGHYPTNRSVMVTAVDPYLTRLYVTNLTVDGEASGSRGWSSLDTVKLVLREELSHTLTAIAVDRAGNTATNVIEAKIDKTAPVIEFTDVTNGGYYNYNFIFGDVRFSDNCSDLPYEAAGLSLKLVGADGSLVEQTNAEFVSPWQSFDGFNFVLEGLYDLSAWVSDAAGNRSETNVRLTVDRTAPKIELANADVRYTNVDRLVEALVTDPALSTVVVKTNGVELDAVSEGAVSNLHRALLSSEEDFEFTVTAYDKANNMISSNFSVMIDRTAPVLTVNGTNAEVFQESGFDFKGEDILGIIANSGMERLTITSNYKTVVASREVYPAVAGEEVSRWVAFGSKGVTNWDGLYTVTALARDRAGNTASTNFTFRVDNVPPVVTFRRGDNYYVRIPNGGILSNDLTSLVSGVWKVTLTQSTLNLSAYDEGKIESVQLLDSESEGTDVRKNQYWYGVGSIFWNSIATNEPYTDYGNSRIRRVNIRDMAGNEESYYVEYRYYRSAPVTVTWVPSCVLVTGSGNYQMARQPFNVTVSLKDPVGIEQVLVNDPTNFGENLWKELSLSDSLSLTNLYTFLLDADGTMTTNIIVSNWFREETNGIYTNLLETNYQKLDTNGNVYWVTETNALVVSNGYWSYWDTNIVKRYFELSSGDELKEEELSPFEGYRVVAETNVLLMQVYMPQMIEMETAITQIYEKNIYKPETFTMKIKPKFGTFTNVDGYYAIDRKFPKLSVSFSERENGWYDTSRIMNFTVIESESGFNPSKSYIKMYYNNYSILRCVSSANYMGQVYFSGPDQSFTQARWVNFLEMEYYFYVYLVDNCGNGVGRSIVFKRGDRSWSYNYGN